MVIDIAAVAEGVEGGEGDIGGIGDGEDIAPGVVGVTDYGVAGAIQNGYHITLQVGGVEVGYAVMGQGQGGAFRSVGEVEGVIPHRQLAQAAAVVDVIVSGSSVGATGAQAVYIVGVIPGGASVGHGGKLPAMLPGVAPCAVAEGIANAVVGNVDPIVGCQQVAPFFVAVGVAYGVGRCSQFPGGVAVLCAAEDIARGVVAPHMGEAAALVILPDELVGPVVGIAGNACAVADGQDVAVIIVGIAVSNIQTRALQAHGGYLTGSGGSRGRGVGKGLGKHGPVT